MEREYWKNLTKREQLLAIAAEFTRAKVWQDNKDKEKFIMALERALEMIDLSLEDTKWRDSLLALLRLRDEVAGFYAFKRTDDISLLYNAL